MAEQPSNPYGAMMPGSVEPQQRVELVELGSSGLKHSGGYLYEEQLKQLQGTKKWKLYQEMEENDATIGAILFVIDALVRQVDWSIQEVSQAPQDLQDKDFVEGALDDMCEPFDDIVSEIMSMLPYGFAPMEVTFKQRLGRPVIANQAGGYAPKSRYSDGLIGWHKISLRAQDTIEQWEIADNGDIMGLWQVAPPNFHRVFIPAEKLYLFRTTKRKNNPEGRSILRTAFRPWYFKKKIENIEGIGIERDLAGLPVIYAPREIMAPSASADEKAVLAQLKRIVTNIRRDEQEGVIMPSAFDADGNQLYKLELLTAGGSRQFKTDDTIKRYRQDIAMSVVADFILLGMDKAGSYSMHSSKTTLFVTALRAVLGVITDVFNRQAIPQLFEVNGWEREAYPCLKFGDIESLDLKELGEYVKALKEIGVDLTDPKLGDYLKRQASLPMSEQEGV